MKLNSPKDKLTNITPKLFDSIEEKELFMETILENNASIILITEAKSSKILYANQAAMKFFKLSQTNLIGLHIYELFQFIDTGISSQEFIKALKNKSTHKILHTTAEGKIIEISICRNTILLNNEVLHYYFIHDLSKDTVDNTQSIAVRKIANSQYFQKIILIFDSNDRVQKAWSNSGDTEKHQIKYKNKTFSELFNADLPKQHTTILSKVKKGSIESFNYTTKDKTKEKEYHCLLSPIFKDKTFHGYIAVIQQINKRYFIPEEAINLYNSVFEHISSGVAAYKVINKGQHFIIMAFNRAAEQIENIAREDIIGKEVTKIFPGIIEMGLLDVFKRVYKTGKPEKHDVALYKDHKRYGWRENYVYKINTNEIIAIYNDVSEKKNLEQQLKEREEEFTRISDNSLEGIIFTNKDVIIRINSVAKQLFGIPNDENILGQSIYSLIATDFHKIIQDEIFTNNTQLFEIRGIKSNGEILYLNIKSERIKYNNDNILNVFYLNDLSKEKHQQKILNQLSFAVNQSANVIVITDIKGNIEFVNPRFCEITGYTIEEVIGQNSRILKSGYQEEQFYKTLWGSISSGQVWSGIFHNKKKDGSLFWEHATISPIKDKSGTIINYLAIKENITDQKKAELALKESELRYKFMVEQSPVPIININPKGTVLKVNKSFVQLVGLQQNPIEQLRKINILDDTQLQSIHFDNYIKETLQDKIVNLPEILYDNSILFQQLKTHQKHKTQVWLTGKMYPIKDEAGKVIEIVILLDDITEKKRAQNLQKAIFNITAALSLTHSLKEYIKFIKDEVGQLIDTSNFYVALYNKENDSLDFPYFSGEERQPTNNYPAKKTLSKYIIETQKPLYANEQHINKLLERGEIISTGAPTKVWLGVPLKVDREVIGVCVVQNYHYENALSKSDLQLLKIIGEQIGISIHQKEYEEKLKIRNEELANKNMELQKASAKAEESDRLKTAFLANMSHEIRTPMNGILGFSELLKDIDLKTEEQQEYIGIIEKSGNRLLNIINELIDISKIEANQMEVIKSTYKINDQLEELYTFFKVEAQNKGIQLIYHRNSLCDHIEVETDNDKMQAIFTNLIKNAIKYTMEGRIEIGYNIHPEELEFYIKDTGIGIPKERQEAIFNRFVQADIEDRSVFEGAGLGLSISKAYIEMLGGKITLESKENIGSTFSFTLPTTIPDSTLAQCKTYSKAKSRRKKLLKTLVVDDERISFTYLNAALKNHCYPILYARNGEEAIHIFEQEQDIQLIFMDIKMPNMNGYETTKAIKKINNEVVIIAQTAFALEGDREKAIAAGCDEYISKPIDYYKLKQLINLLF